MPKALTYVLLILLIIAIILSLIFATLWKNKYWYIATAMTSSILVFYVIYLFFTSDNRIAPEETIDTLYNQMDVDPSIQNSKPLFVRRNSVEREYDEDNEDGYAVEIKPRKTFSIERSGILSNRRRNESTRMSRNSDMNYDYDDTDFENIEL